MKTNMFFMFGMFLLAVFTAMPFAIAGPHIGSGFDSGINLDASINPNNAMSVWKCGTTFDFGENSDSMYDRQGDYLFEGEKIIFDTIAIVPSGIKDNSNQYITKAYVTIGSSSQLGNTIVAECSPYTDSKPIPQECGVVIDNRVITEFDSNTMVYYTCTMTAQGLSAMQGEKYISVEAWNIADGNKIKIQNDENFYLNPAISLRVEGVQNGIEFNNLEAGETSYSDTITVTNTINPEAGVILNLFLSGTDFKDMIVDNTGTRPNLNARCPELNVLSLDRFRYYAINGAYQTIDDPRQKDSEGYLNIGYGAFGPGLYGRNELIQLGQFPEDPEDPLYEGKYYHGSTLTPNSQAYITYKVNLPNPCSGNFDDGQMYIWAEAI